MDAFTVSIFAKKNLGFFLTAHKKAEGAQEHELQENAHKIASEKLREKKIRAINVHENWSAIQEIAGAVETQVDKFCDEAKVDIISRDTGASLAQAFAIVMSCLGQQNSVIQRVRENKN